MSGFGNFGIRNAARGAVTADVIVYGTTPSGIIAAIEAKRNGASVALVGGWRDYNVGGMMSGGLLNADCQNFNAVTGLARTLFDNCNTLLGHATTPLQQSNANFPPYTYQTAFQNMLTAAGITPYLTKGISTFRKNGTRLEAFRTVDGQVFNGKVFIDASYEGDMLPPAGISFRNGRDANNASNPLDGYLGSTNGLGSYNIDPYNTPGDSASGVLKGIFKPAGAYPSFGAANKSYQAFNFRLTLNHYVYGGTPTSHFIPMPTTPPAGYDVSKYEIFLRYCAARTALGDTFNTSGSTGWRLATHLSAVTNIFTDMFDCNQAGGVLTIDVPSTEGLSPTGDYLMGGASEYIGASYARREQIWKNHESWQRGLFYLIQQRADNRIPVNMQAVWQTFGFDDRCYLNPHPNDVAGWPYQLYVRMGRRLNSEFTLNKDDITMADGTTPRSILTIAQGAYFTDSHIVQNIINGGFVQTEGDLFAAAGGTDGIFPIPYECIRPRATECTNLLVTFALSVSSQCFTATRLEFDAMECGQAAGCAAAMAALATTQPDIQNVDYTTLRAQLLSEGMTLTQTN